MSNFPTNVGYIGIAAQRQATTFNDYYKTTEVVPAQFVKYLSDGSGPEYDEQVLEEGGDGRYDRDAVKTMHREAVALSCLARPVMAPNLFGALLGKDVPAAMPTTLPTTLIKHTMNIKTTDLATTPLQPWLTLERQISGFNVHRIVGAKLSSITLSGEAGQPILMTVEGTGLTGKIVLTTSLTDTYETANPYSFFHGVYHINAPTTSNFEIKSFSVKINMENAEEIQTTGLTRRDIINLKARTEVEIALNYVDFVMFQKANYGAGIIPTEAYSDGSLNIIMEQGAANTLRRLQIYQPLVRLKPHMLNLDPGANVQEQPLSGYALKQATTSLVTVTAYNIVATTMPI